MFNVTATVTYANGTKNVMTESITVGTDLVNSFNNGSAEVDTSITPDGRVKLSLLNIDKPKGDTLPRLDGYVVICGDHTNGYGQDDTTPDSIDGAFTLSSFVGSPSKTGTTNPWKVALDSGEMEVDGRMPIPSTWGQMESAGVLSDVARSFLGKGSKYVTHPQDTAPYKGQPSWWYYVPPERVRQYGQGCNQIGWNNYGHYDISSASTMCSGRTGTCVPGYDLRGSKNFTEALVKPTVQVPAFVGRVFSNYEINWAKNTPAPDADAATIPIPEYVPPGWNPRLPNYWVHNNFLFTDSDQEGQPAFGSGDIRIRVNLAVAGQLLSAVGSLSGGQLYYRDGVTTAPAGDPTSLANDDGYNCVIGLSDQRGVLNVVVKNTGSTTATYSLRTVCDGNVTATSQPTNVGVASGGGGTSFAIALEGSNSDILSATSPRCTVALLAGDIENAVLSELPVACSVTQNVNLGAGAVTLNNGSGGPPPLDPDRHGKGDGDQKTFCDSAGWLCDFNLFGGIAGWAESMLMWLFWMAMLIIVVLMFIRFIEHMNEATYEKVANMRAMRNVARISAVNAQDKVRSMRRMMPEKEIKRLDGDIAERTAAMRATDLQ